MDYLSHVVKMDHRRTPLKHLPMNSAISTSPMKSEERLYMDAALWIEDRTGVDILPDSRHFAEVLQDGELLLKIAESVAPDVAAEMKAVHTKESWYEGWNEVGMARAVENIHIFLSICRAVGVSEQYHFSASDLIKGREIKRVVECLMLFRKIVTPQPSYMETPETVQELGAEQAQRSDYSSPKTVVPASKAGNDASSQSNAHETYDSVSEKSIWYSALADAYNNVVEMSPSPGKREIFSKKELPTRKLQFPFSLGSSADTSDGPYQAEIAEMIEKVANNGDHSPESAKSLLLAQSPSVLQKRICTTDDVFIVKKFAMRLAAKERVVKELVAELSTALRREEALQTKVTLLERGTAGSARDQGPNKGDLGPGESAALDSRDVDSLRMDQGSKQESMEMLDNLKRDLETSQAESASLKERLCAAQAWTGKLKLHYDSALRGLKEDLDKLKEEFLQAQAANVELLLHTGSDFNRITKDYMKLKSENKHLRNELQELKGNIRVFCRVRPMPSETECSGQGVFCPGEEVVIVENQKNSSMNFVYDKVYGPPATQEHVFMDVLPLVRSVMEGYNVCIFAYGQTGSGKTYTMMGPSATEHGAGVVHRSIDLLFNLKKDTLQDWEFKISAEIIEIYNETVRDLLAGLNKSFTRVEQRRLDNSIRGSDSVQVHVESTHDVIQLMEIGARNRAVGATSMNEHSSRSHCIVILRVEGVQKLTGEKIFSSLNLIDLAGSERVSRSEATGDRLKETQHINKSLAALGDVMQALLEKRSHIPFRNSKLTQLLQDSLGGNSRVVMLAHVAPERESVSESISTLKFASRLLNVELGMAGKNKGGFRQLQAMVSDKDKEVDEVKRQLDESQKLAAFKIEGCKKELVSKKAEAKALAARVAMLEQKNRDLEQRLEQGSTAESTMSNLQRQSASLNSSISSEIIRSDAIARGRLPRYPESRSLSRVPSTCSTLGDASEVSSPELQSSREPDLGLADNSPEQLSSSETELACVPPRKLQPREPLSRSKDFGHNVQHGRKFRIPSVSLSTNGHPALRESIISTGMLPVGRVQKYMSKRSPEPSRREVCSNLPSYERKAVAQVVNSNGVQVFDNADH